MSNTISTAPTVHSIKVINDPPDDYIPYRAEKIKESCKTGFQAAMAVLFAHTADVFTCIVDIIADKYDLDAEEMINTIIKDPKYTSLSKHPVINSLTYFNQEDADKHTGKQEETEAQETATKKTVKKKTATQETGDSETAAEEPPKKTVKKKTATQETGDSETAAEEPPKRVIKIVRKNAQEKV
jgi:hypothetical protein